MTHVKQVFAFLSLTLLIILGTVGVAHAQFQTSDIFAGVNDGKVLWLRNGTIVATLNTGAGGFTTGMAFDAAGNLYVTGFDANIVAKFDTSGVLQTGGGSFTSGGPGLLTPESVVFDSSGNLYVGNRDKAHPTTGEEGSLQKFDAFGNYLGNVLTNTRVDFFDLSFDQSTFIYGQEGTDILTVSNGLPGTPGGNFATGCCNRAFAMRFLPDGGVLLADLNDVKRFKADGTLMKTYDIGGEDTWFSLNLDPDGTSFWSGSIATGIVYRFDILTGAVVETLNTGAGGNVLTVWRYSVS